MVANNQCAGINLIQDERRQEAIGSFIEARDPRYMNVVDPTMPWLNENIQVANNVFGNGGAFQLFALNGKTVRAVDGWNLTVNGNLFNPRLTRSDPGGVGKGDHMTVERYETPAALAAAKGPSWRNAQIPGPKTLAAMAGDRVCAG
jgi:hypothetical protein